MFHLAGRSGIKQITIMKTVKNYNKNNNTVINRKALAALVPAARRWAKKSGTLEALTAKRSVDRELSEKQLKKYVDNTIMAIVKAYTAAEEKAAEVKAAQKAAAAAKKAQEKHDREMNACVDDTWHYVTAGEVCTGRYNYSEEIGRAIRTGTNEGDRTAKFADKNGITCREWYDNQNGYSRRCKFAMVRRDFCLNIRKGYKCRVIGGLLTFYRGKFNRQGMACEWVEQGRALADLVTVKGYIVRGEHIEAKSLKEAKRINAEHRTALVPDAIEARRQAQERHEREAAAAARRSAMLKEAEARHDAEMGQKVEALAGYMFTFADSLACGNCRPGTQSFKARYEEAIGHEAAAISGADLYRYGKIFGLSYYTDRLINYIYNNLKK